MVDALLIGAAQQCEPQAQTALVGALFVLAMDTLANLIKEDAKLPRLHDAG
jgi:hypothetical protein